jgi:transposase
VQLEAGFQTTPKNRPFGFEKFWIEHPTFKEKIKQWWREEQPEKGTRMFNFYKKLKYIKYRLKEWNKDTFGNINQQKNNIEEKNEKTLGNLHFAGLYGGTKKGRDPDDPGMGSSMPEGRNTLATKVPY